MAKKITIAAPAGMRGIAVTPWSKNEVYAVAADWSQAGSPVLVYGDNGWTHEWHGRQVADFRHSPQAALESVIREVIEMNGDEPDDDEVAGIVADADDLRDHDLAEMVDILERHGDRFIGNDADDEAQDWIDHDFSAEAANAWCKIGVWDAATAAAFRDSGKTPEQIRIVAESLIEAAGDDASKTYVDGDPIYSACNGDTDTDDLIFACE